MLISHDTTPMINGMPFRPQLRYGRGMRGLGAGTCVLVPNSNPPKYADLNTGVPCDPNAPAGSGGGTIYNTGPVGTDSGTQTVQSTVAGPFSGTQLQPTIASFLEQELYARTSSLYELRAGIAATPTELGPILQQEAQNYCTEYPTACAGVDIQSLISGLVSQYTQWYNNGLSDYWTLVDQGHIAPVTGAPPPPAGFVAPSGSNVLSNVTPSNPAPVTSNQNNVLNPPQGGTGVNQSSVNNGSFTGSSDVGNGVGTNTNNAGSQMQISSWIQNNWALLAAAAAALVLLPNMMQHR